MGCGKARLKRKIRSFCLKKASVSRKRASSHEHTLFFLRRRADNGEDVSSFIADTRAELEDLHRHQSRCACIRSKVQWAEEGESSTSYFFVWKSAMVNAVCFQLCGPCVASLSRLLWTSPVFGCLYGSLFTAQSLDLSHQDFFLDQISQKLTEAQRDLCEGELTLDECKHALDGLASGKSPG